MVFPRLEPPRKLITRRRLILLVGGASLFTGLRFGHARLARASKPSGPLSKPAQALLDECWKGLDPKRVLDTHCHMLGTGESGSGCYVSKRLTSVTNPWEYFKFTVYEEAAGVK